ncbi:winged helix DNA-binding protein [Streptomyces alboflavus]|uniref:LexA family protein n=1 Tax=Streptomyces alboflavus TaxID=67267 RepID=UPI000F6575A4|nr:winged helix DNA-binding protein [Streptomyces alboflavus]
MSGPLSDVQARIVRSAREWVAEYGEAPSVRELGKAVGLSSTSSIQYHLRRLRERGLVVEARGRRSGRCPHCGR